MKKAINHLKNNIQFSISVLAILCLLFSNAYLVVKAEEGSVSAESKVEISDENSDNKLEETESGLPTPQDIPHLNCVSRLYHNTPSSTTYNPNAPYNLDFYRGNFHSGFQDINGDNLPDYVLVDENMSGNDTNGYTATHEACVYLNNGGGWDEVYACHATTKTNGAGEAIIERYFGDCAGEPSGTSNK